MQQDALPNAQSSPASESSAANPASTTMRRIRSGCCPRAASGNAAAVPRTVMNSRRLMGTPRQEPDQSRCGSYGLLSWQWQPRFTWTLTRHQLLPKARQACSR